MRKFGIFCMTAALAIGAQASWYWPFGSDENETAMTNRPPRLSKLMEPATTNIEAATQFADEGKIAEAVERYRIALTELDRIESENADRAKKPEFATLRNKRAYVNAAIDSLLLEQMRGNARAVAVTDTTELERRLEVERNPSLTNKVEKSDKGTEKAKAKKIEKKAEKSVAEKAKAKKAKAKTKAKKSKPKKAKEPAPVQAAQPLTKRDEAIAAIEAGQYDKAAAIIDEMLLKKPKSVVALNLRASLESARGNLKDAEVALDQAIESNPQSYFAYYNMARLMLKKYPDDTSRAKLYYDIGLSMGGPEDSELAEKIK